MQLRAQMYTELPKEPGFYVGDDSSDGILWELADNGYWYDGDYLTSAHESDWLRIADCGPFTMLPLEACGLCRGHGSISPESRWGVQRSIYTKCPECKGMKIVLMKGGEQ